MNKISLLNVNPFHLKNIGSSSSVGPEFEYRQIARLAPIEEPNLKVVASLLFNLLNELAEANLTPLEKWYCNKSKEGALLMESLIPFDRTLTGEVITLTDAQVEYLLKKIPQVKHDLIALINGAEYYIQGTTWAIEGSIYKYPFLNIILEEKIPLRWENYTWINIINRPFTEIEIEENHILATSPNYTITDGENIFLEGFRYNTYISPEERKNQVAMLEYLDSVDTIRATNINDLLGGSGSFTPNEHAIEREVLTKVCKSEWRIKDYIGDNLCAMGYATLYNEEGLLTGTIITKLVQSEELIYNHKPLYYIALNLDILGGDDIPPLLDIFTLTQLYTTEIPIGIHTLVTIDHNHCMIPSGFLPMIMLGSSSEDAPYTVYGECMNAAEMQYISTSVGYAISGNAGPLGVIYEFNTACVFVPPIDSEQIREEYNVAPEEYILKVLRGEIEIFESIQLPG